MENDQHGAKWTGKSQSRVWPASASIGGLAPDVAEIDVLTGMAVGDCGIPFEPGETYVVHAFVSKDGLVHGGICSSTRRIDEAGVALRILRARRDGQKVPTLAGQIVQRDRNFRGLLGSEASKALPNALVWVRSDGRSYQTIANAEGLYAFYDLPDGRYEFAPDLPQGTTLPGYIGSDRPPAPFELIGSGCQERDIEVFASGSVQGRVLDLSKRALPHAFVYIIPTALKVLPQERRQLYRESQTKEGFFRFVHTLPASIWCS